METTELGFERYFSLDEAAAMLPWVRESLARAHEEINAAQDEALLYKRIALMRKRSGKKASESEVSLLADKYEALATLLQKWQGAFMERGILLRDVRTGLLDFPYHSERLERDFFLCWRSGEDGIFYFHAVDDGFMGRQPISLLPD